MVRWCGNERHNFQWSWIRTLIVNMLHCGNSLLLHLNALIIVTTSSASRAPRPLQRLSFRLLYYLPFKCRIQLKNKTNKNLPACANATLNDLLYVLGIETACSHAPSSIVGTNLSSTDLNCLTHWGRVTHICVVKLTIIGSDNGLSPGRRQAIIWTNAGILLIGPIETNFIEILIGIQTF